MIFRQLFDSVSSTFTYLLAERPGGEALIIDPVLERVDDYVQLVKALDLQLIMALDTHVHADHVTGIGQLRELTHCTTALGEQARVDCVDLGIVDGELIKADGLQLKAIYTPGHTDDSYSFLLGERVFTGDTLMIRGCGRTDFQNGDPGALYDSLFNRLLRLPGSTQVYPAHDYEGRTSSTIDAEIRHNPRLQITSRRAFIDQMNSLRLEPPKRIDEAVPANRNCGLMMAP